AAIECALRWVAAEPLMEEARCALIRLYLAAGQVDAARVQYQEMERLWREELGSVPSPAAQALAARRPDARRADPPSRGGGVAPGLVRAASPAPAPPSAMPPPSTARPRLPLYLTRFFGREAELDRLQELLGVEGLGRSGVQEAAPNTR